MAEGTDDKKTKRNVTALREILWDQIDLIRQKDPQFDLNRAALIIKAADSIMTTVKLELQHAALLKQTQPLPVLEGDHGGTPLIAGGAVGGGSGGSAGEGSEADAAVSKEESRQA